MKFIYTFACFIGATTLGMIFASGLSWLCTFPFSHALFIALIALLILYVFSGSVKDNGWKKAFFNALVPLTAGLTFTGCILWFCGELTLSVLNTCAPAHLTVIVGLVTVCAFVLAFLAIFFFFDFLCEIGNCKIKHKRPLYHVGVFVTISCCIAIMVLTLYYVIYPICLH